jgi:hypothetical protein
LAAALLGLPCLLWVARSVAETESEPKADVQVDTLFQEGRAAFDRGDYEAAEQAYREAWQRRRSYDLAANLGQTEVQLGRYREAAEHLSYALGHVPPSVSDEVRQEMQRLLSGALEHVATLRVEVDPPGAEVMVGSRVVGKAPLEGDIYVEPGSRSVQARHEGHRDAEKSFTATEGSTHRISLVLEPIAASDVKPEAEASVPSSTSADVGDAPQVVTSGPDPVVVWIGGGLAVGGLFVGILSAVAAHDRRSERDDLLAGLDGTSPCGTGSLFPDDCARIEDLDAEARSLDTVTWLGFGAAGVLAGATLVYALWPRSNGDRHSIGIAPTIGSWGSGVSLAGSF